MQDGNFKIIHIIDTNQYRTFIDETTTVIESQVLKSYPLYPYLCHELTQIQDLFNNLKPHRAKRSLNFIGSAWKWIAGNPDHEDFVMIQEKINNVLKNNNKQVVINELYNERINNITEVANKIFELAKDGSMLNAHLVLSMQYKLKLIKEELINIGYAIHWAKSGIVNSRMLSKTEIKLATEILDKEFLPYSTPEEALEFAEVKVITNSTSIFYIINIPITTNATFHKLLIKSVKRNNVVNDIPFEYILKNKVNVFGIIKNCKTIGYLSICNQKNILDISKTTCIPHLLRSIDATCNKINNQHVPTIDEISEGILLLNQFSGIIKIADTLHNLNGTFLIKFHNTTVSINERLFISKEESTFHALPAILQLNPKEEEYRELLSLEMMKALHINNTNEIKLLQAEKNTHQITNYTLFACIGVFVIIVVICKLKPGKNQTKIVIEKAEMIPEKHNVPEKIICNNSVQTSSFSIPHYSNTSHHKFNNIPYF